MTEFSRAVYTRLVGTLALDSGDVEMAQEFAQEALTRAYEHWPTVSALDSPEAWTFRVAFNLQASWFRRRAIRRRFERRNSLQDRSPAADPADAVAVREAIGQLPTRQRQAIVLRYYADFPVRDTATVMGCRQGTVKALTSQALDALRKRLGPLSVPEGGNDHG